MCEIVLGGMAKGHELIQQLLHGTIVATFSTLHGRKAGGPGTQNHLCDVMKYTEKVEKKVTE